MAAGAASLPSSFPYDSHENCKFVAKRIHTYLHDTYTVVAGCMRVVSEFDRLLYSAETRAAIQSRLTNSEDAELRSWLETPEHTRTHVYHFCVKGSNSLALILYYLRRKYEEDLPPTLLPMSYESDWDTTVLINPALLPRQFECVFETLVPILQKGLIECSRMLQCVDALKKSLEKALEFIHVSPEYERYRKYPITLKQDRLPLKIHDSTAANPATQEWVAALGPGGPGMYVTSNRELGAANLGNGRRTPPIFFLGRILAHVIASKNKRLPVELFDISMNYQNDDLRFSWESYSEYHIAVPDAGADFRVISPVGLYTDTVKCLYNYERASNNTRKNKASKVPARMERIRRIYEDCVIPYGSANEIMRRNIERHTGSPRLVGSIVRRMRATRRRPRNTRSYYNEAYEEDEEELV
jgi:hypothetical protein